MNRSRKRSTIVWTTLALVAVCAAYANSFHNAFHFDDFHTITDNPAIRSLRNLPRFFIDVGTFSVLPANRTYRPVVSASLALDYALGHGYAPFWFHLSTFLCFLALLALIFLLYRHLAERTEESPDNFWLALIGAAWFGLHPAVAETVNYIIQRGDIYCTLGCVAALVAFARNTHLRKTGLYLLPLIFALLSKPPAAVFPVLLFFYVFFFDTQDKPGRVKASLIAAVPSLIVTALLMGLQSLLTPKSFTPSIVPAWSYRLTQPFVWLRYFGEFFLPVHLNVDTDLAVIDHFDGRVLLGLFFFLCLSAAIWFTARRRVLYPISFGLIWFVATQLPTSLYPLSEVENDHRMFFSFAGLILAVVWAARLFLRRMLEETTRLWLRRVLVGGIILALGAYAWGVHVRNRVWRSEESLWRDDVEKSPHNGRGLMIYGLTQMNKGDFAQALDYFDRASQFTPNYPTLEINLGVANGAMSRNTEAERHFLRAISLAPNDDTTHAFYGRRLNSEGRTSEAIEQLRAAIALNPQRPMQHEVLLDAYSRAGDPEALRKAAAETLAAVPGDAVAEAILLHSPPQNASYWINLSLDQYRRGQYQHSIESARHALQLNPRSAEAYNNIGASYGAMQQWEDAVHNEHEALRLQPQLQIARNNLALFLAKKTPGGPQLAVVAELINRSLVLNRAGKYEESIAAARDALRLDPRCAEAWNNIAADYEAMHRWDEAIAAARKAIALKPDFQLARNNLAWSESQKQPQQEAKP